MQEKKWYDPIYVQGGGFGEVFRAKIRRDDGTAEAVAIKCIRRTSSHHAEVMLAIELHNFALVSQHDVRNPLWGG
jgi:hypothetical protein